MTTSVKLPTGPVKKVYTPFGRPVKELEDFRDKAKYICCGAEKLNKEQSRDIIDNIFKFPF